MDKQFDYYNEKIRDEILSHPAQKGGYVCPICGSGSGSHGTGITSKDNYAHFTCWAGCYTSASPVDIIAKKNDMNSKDAKTLLAWLNTEYGKAPTDYVTREPAVKAEPKEIVNPQFMPSAEFFEEAQKNLKKAYKEGIRGISHETLEKYEAGYIERWRHPTDKKSVSSPRIIFKFSELTYEANCLPEQDGLVKIRKSKVNGNPDGRTGFWIFNAQALQNATRPIFITEGIWDALSIIELGGEAVALSSTSQSGQLIDLLKDNPPAQPLVLALDSDQAGTECREKLEKNFSFMGIRHTAVNITNDISAGRNGDKVKDANDLLRYVDGGREVLAEMIQYGEEKAMQSP